MKRTFTTLFFFACSHAPAPTSQDGATAFDAAFANEDGGARDAESATDAGADSSSTPLIRIHYPAATHTISLRGSGAPWNWQTGVTCIATAADTFSCDASKISARVEWKPLLDDKTWALGPNYHVSAGQSIDIYPHFSSTNGQVKQLIAPFHSSVLKNDRTVWAYLPASYDENPTAHYSVVYMHDGQNLFDPQAPWGGWHVNDSLDKMANVGLCSDGKQCNADSDCSAGECGAPPEVIVVAPENAGAQRLYEYTPTQDANDGQSGGGARYLQMLAQELKPAIDHMLRTQPERESTAIMGSSLGGLISIYGSLLDPDVFGRVGALSPSTWWDNRVVVGAVAASQGKLLPLRVYLDSGDASQSDGFVDTQTLDQTYLSIGFVEGSDLHYLVQPGGKHREDYWAARFPGAIAFLFGLR